MQSGYEIDQIFVKRKQGQTEILLVCVAPSGALKRETLQFPTLDNKQALSQAARHLAGRTDIGSLGKTRLRVDKTGQWADDASLQKHFKSEYKSASDY